MKRRLRGYFIAGTLALVPLTITYVSLRYLFAVLDGLLMPLIIHLLIRSGFDLQPGDHIPGVGLVATLLLILLTGFMTRSFLGRKLGRLWEMALQRIPLVSSIYFASKQLVDAFSIQNKKAFREVVLLEYPRRGAWAIGFVTSEGVAGLGPGLPTLFPVFVATTPNPTSGMLVLVPEQDLVRTSLSVEDGIKLIVSGGILAPNLVVANAPPAPGDGHQS
jgi:uncharacterized membrane protein